MSHNRLCVILLILLFGNVAWAEDATVEIYGKVHASVDVSDDGASDHTSVSNNSSRIGFRGSKALIRDIKGIFVIESSVDISGEGGGLSARNRYVGLAGQMGTVLFGIYDTPFKRVGRSVDIFSDTIGDQRAILGSSADNTKNHFDVRAKNAMAYISPKSHGVQFKVLYSTGSDGATGPDDQNDELASVSLGYEQGPVMVAVAYQDTRIDSAVRGAVRFKTSQGLASVIYESTSTDAGGSIQDRTAFGLNGAFNLGLLTVAAEYVSAAEADSGANTGATFFAIGAFQSVSKSTRVYTLFSAVDNDSGAQFRNASGGHGDYVSPAALGQDASAFSVGIIHKF